MKLLSPFILLILVCCGTSCYRHVRTAVDVTPGNFQEKLDWRYGAADIRIQTTKINRQLFDRWFLKTGQCDRRYKPRLLISEIDNCTDQYIPTEMIREIIEGVAIEDGRYIVVAGNSQDEEELDYRMGKNLFDPKYNPATCLAPQKAIAPQFLAKIRLTKAIRTERFYTYEDYRMSVTLYDIETQVAIDSAWDVLSKKVCR